MTQKHVLFAGAVSCYCCERYSVRIPKIKKQLVIDENDHEDPCVLLTRADYGDRRPSAVSETDC